MFGFDEFGHSRLLPIAFALLFTVLGIATVATSETLWSPDYAAVQTSPPR